MEMPTETPNILVPGLLSVVCLYSYNPPVSRVSKHGGSCSPVAASVAMEANAPVGASAERPAGPHRHLQASCNFNVMLAGRAVGPRLGPVGSVLLWLCGLFAACLSSSAPA